VRTWQARRVGKSKNGFRTSTAGGIGGTKERSKAGGSCSKRLGEKKGAWRAGKPKS
jgi:hypothetical protein